MTKIDASAAVQKMIVNGLGGNVEDYDMAKLLENLYKLNGRSWDTDRLDWILLVEIIEAHRN